MSGGRVGCWVGSFGRYAPPSGRRMETGRTEPFPFPMQTPFYFANWNNDRCVSFLPSIRWKPELIIGTFRKSISASFCLRFASRRRICNYWMSNFVDSDQIQTNVCRTLGGFGELEKNMGKKYVIRWIVFDFILYIHFEMMAFQVYSNDNLQLFVKWHIISFCKLHKYS